MVILVSQLKRPNQISETFALLKNVATFQFQLFKFHLQLRQKE